MAVIGNSATQQAFTPAVDYFSGNASTTAFTLSRPVASVAQVEAVIDNVVQNPSSAYTVSGNTITFTSAPLSGTNNIYVRYTSPITQVIAPGQGTVNTTALGNITNIASGNSSLTLQTGSGNTTAVTIDTSQRVGVGVTPSAWTVSVIQLKNSAYRASGNGLGLVANAYYDGTWKYIATDYAQDYYQQDGAHVWRYAGLGTAGNAVSWTEAGRFDNSGNLLVGLTANSYNSKLTVQSDASAVTPFSINDTSTGSTSRYIATWYRGGSSVGNISITNTTTAYNTSSDYRLKENIAPMTGALAKVALLKPVTYKWNYDNSDGEGFIAHELQEVCPHAVTGEKDAVNEDGSIKPQGIDTSYLVATLTAALQELKALVDAQATEIAELKAKVGV